MPTEADTCRVYVVPKLYAAGWSDDQIREQVSITDGRVLLAGRTIRRGSPLRPDYILRYRRDFPIAVIEAKSGDKQPQDGLQKAIRYAEMLGVKFAYATNGHGIVEHDFMTGTETLLDAFPRPDELWQRLRRSEGLDDDAAARNVLTPYYHAPGWKPRYYQEIAINRAVQAILQGKPRILLTLATGTGKTWIAFQISYRLWQVRWNARNDPRRKPRILYLADRVFLVDDPKDKTFAPFGDARHKIQGEAVKSRELYFATYQSLARDERRPGLYRDYAPDFFDLIIVDECHRGSARDDSNWREILDYFTGAYQLGMTATPLREDNRDTYAYFGNPLYTYSLRQGIGDGFLAPYRVHRIVSAVDATGYRPVKGELDLHGRELPDRLYETPDFDRTLSHEGRRRALARHLTEYLKQTDRFDKTIVFCPDQESALLLRQELVNQNSDLVAQFPDYVCRVTADEGDLGRGHLSRFQELETRSPVILTTSQLLTTGLDAPTVKNIVIMRTVNAMTEFKQIIGLGTRIRDDYGKYYFTILDYTGSATRLFADPEFDGEPARIVEETIDHDGNPTATADTTPPEPAPEPGELQVAESGAIFGLEDGEDGGPRTKYYVDGGQVEIAADLVYELDADGNQLRIVRLTDYTREKVLTLFATAAELRTRWARPREREAVLEALAERGIDLDRLREATRQPDADPFDLLCHIVYNQPLRTRRERADRLKKDAREFLERFAPEARQILEEILEKYAEYGVAQLTDPKILKVPPLSEHGTVTEIAACFGGIDHFHAALNELQSLLYAA